MFEGVLQKMLTEWADPIRYYLPMEGDFVLMNGLIGRDITLRFVGFRCMNCGLNKPIYRQGYVYLANSGEVKVGVTRKSQAPTRWIDQGAHEALILAEVPNRYLAGVAEVALKEKIADKTNWRKMLTNQIHQVDLLRVKLEVREFVPEEVQPYITEDITPLHIHFPVEKYPTQVQSLQLLQTPTYKGKLMGIKGQYLLFEDNTVLNVRGNEGLIVQLTIDN